MAYTGPENLVHWWSIRLQVWVFGEVWCSPAGTNSGVGVKVGADTTPGVDVLLGAGTSTCCMKVYPVNLTL